MSTSFHYQQTLPVPLERAWRACTDSDELERWFAEHAQVSLDDRRYDFWGRFTPGTPDEEAGHHPIEALEPFDLLRYRWHFRGDDTAVELRFAEREGHTLLGLWHHDVSSTPGAGEFAEPGVDDIWLHWLENLARHIEGRPVIRRDFSTMQRGDMRHTVDIGGPPAAVWDALTTPASLERWIASSARVTLVPGGDWKMGWEGYDTFEIIDLDPGTQLRVSWEIQGRPTVVTWTLEGSGGRTRLTLVHSGFGPDELTGGVQAGWLKYLTELASLIERGNAWYPALKEITTDVATFYVVGITARQHLLEWKAARRR